MALGDLAFFYHSGGEKRIVGIVKVTKLYRPDPSDESGRFGMVDVKAVKPFAEPVTLAQIKADTRLKDLTLVRNSRLSVQPVDKASWTLIRSEDLRVGYACVRTCRSRWTPFH